MRHDASMATYAAGRVFHDADSHLMETHGWLEQYADPGIRSRIRPLQLAGAGASAPEAVDAATARDPSDGRIATLEQDVMADKGWAALGASDPCERSHALDRLGFDRQLVFATFAATQFAGKDLELLYGGTRALNRAMVDFCSHDPRLLAVGFVPLTDPALAAVEVEAALELGVATIQVPSLPGRTYSPTHPDYDGVWARLQDAGVAFVLHIGGGGRGLHPRYHENGRPRPTDFLGGGENVRAKDYMTIAHSPETFLSCLILDGLFDAYPRLRGGCIEQGAMWVVPWLRRLDLAMTFARTEPILRALARKPSEYVHEHLWFTPFPGEPVGWMIEECGDDLFLFSSDYPHPEGTRDPIQRFEATMDGTEECARDRFYRANFEAMMGDALTA
jgi:predicted TIM-barrel fold metal-dependent hydrolase